MLVSTAFVLQILLGFALLENGLIREKNSKNILIKNMFDMCVSTLAFWFFGYGLAFGRGDEGNNKFVAIDSSMFVAAKFSELDSNAYLRWIF